MFAEKGYEATTVGEIAEAAGISRRTFFRQFRAKEDVVFADHEILMARASAYLDDHHDDPWDAVCAAAALVFEGFSQWGDIAKRRYAVVHEVPALRDREIVTVFRYERLFVDYLRRQMPAADDLAVVQFAAAVTATHNFLLRRMVRDGVTTSVEQVRDALSDIRRGFDGSTAAPGSDEVVVAVFSKGMSPRRVAEELRKALSD